MGEIIREEPINVKGTTKLVIGDPMYLTEIEQGTDRGAEKELVFIGNISAAPYGRIRIRQKHEKYNGPDIDTIFVTNHARRRRKNA